jgi:polysaccharide export outer membrane protein
MSTKALSTALLAVALLAGCSSTPPLEGNVSPNLTVVDALPSAGPIDPVTQLPVTQLGPYDVLNFVVAGIEGLDGDVTVDGQGTVSIPVAGRFKAAGLTPQQLEQQIEQGLRANFVRNPDVALNLKEMVSQRVTVEGAVLRSGSYPILPGMTLLRAIASAQGLSEYAKSSEVVVFRTINGNRYATLYNLQAIREGHYDDPVIYPQDVVVVGESGTSRMMQRIMTMAPGLLSPLSVLLTR